MSLQAITAVLTTVHDCNPAEKLLLIILANYANPRGRCWPGVERLARDTSMSQRTITRLIPQLEQKKHLQVERNWGPKGTNCYMLNCIVNGKYDPPTKEEMAAGDPDTMSPLTPCLHPDKLSPPLETLGNQPPPLTPCHGDDTVSPRQTQSQMSPELKGTNTQQQHQNPAGEHLNSERQEPMPSVAEVTEHARCYSGNFERGVPDGTKIPDDWTTAYWGWRTFKEEFWPKLWQKEIYWRFEGEWLADKPKARGRVEPKKNVGGNGVWAVKQRLEMLKKRAASHPANEASAAYCGDPDEAATREFEQIRSAMRECERKLEGGT